MINVSNEFKEIVSGNDRTFYASAEITFSDNTVLNLDNSQLSGLKIDDGGKFGLGTAIINKLTLSINNLNDEFSDYDFTDAIIRPSIGLQLSETIESLHKGVFIAENPKAIGSIIHITAFDNMIKFDKPFSEVSQVFPCTIRDLLITVCNHCGVSLATSTFYNQDYIIKERLDDVATCREVISWIAGISVSIARCNVNGALELRWYDIETLENEACMDCADGGIFDSDTPYSTGDNVDGGTFAFNDGDNVDGGNFNNLKKYHHFYSHIQTPTVATDDVVITGVSIPITTENSVTYGESGYMYTLEGNKLIQDELDAEYVAEKVGQKIIGMRFRPLSIVVRSDPSVEAGDIAIVSTRKGVYQTLISSVSYSVGQPMRIENDAEPPLRNSSKRYSEMTKAIVEARKEIDKKITAYDLAVQQLNDLVSHSFGVYKTAEELEDGSVIYYLHDKPTLEESTKIWKQTADAFAISTDGGQTYTAGFDAEGNAVFNVLSAIGINADWIRTGKLLSNDGATLIDMAYGVANSDNFSFIDNIQSGFPLVMPFNIDDSVSKINKVLLKYTQQKFRTYSKTASSGGGSSVTSASGGGATQTSSSHQGEIYPTTSNGGHSHDAGAGGSINLSTNQMNPPAGTPHSHTVIGGVDVSVSIGSVPDHIHTINWPSHSHTVEIPSHTHGVSIPSHTHNLDFGIQEQAISNYAIDIYVDGILRVQITDSSANEQGIVDLTQWVTTTGWHEIEVRSTTLKRVSAQLNIKSYIRS